MYFSLFLSVSLCISLALESKAPWDLPFYGFLNLACDHSVGFL